jgi:hypothetical protein
VDHDHTLPPVSLATTGGLAVGDPLAPQSKGMNAWQRAASCGRSQYAELGDLYAPVSCESLMILRA